MTGADWITMPFNDELLNDMRQNLPVSVPVLLLTGPMGVGKTSTMDEVGDLLKVTNTRFASIDLDAICQFRPRPVDDRFGNRLMFRNLAAIWSNYSALGMERLLLARVLEARAELESYREAIPGAEIVVVRLRASEPTLHDRLRGREIGLNQEFALRRASELLALMDDSMVEDYIVDTEGRSINAIAREVIAKVGWLSQ